jgi:hypothetical protein
VAERWDRDAVARILARAHEIEARRNDDDAVGIDAEALVQAATEVGIDANAVRDAMAIERLSNSAQPAARLDRLAGPRRLVVERELTISVAAAISGAEAWLSSTHRMLCDRRDDSTLYARRRTDTSAQIGRWVTELRGQGRLGAVRALRIEATPLIVGSTPSRPRTLVRVSAERAADRRNRLVGAGAAGVAGVGMGLGAVVAGGALVTMPLVSAPLVGAGFVVARSGRGDADRLELELERLLSLVGRGAQPVSAIGSIARRATQAAPRRLATYRAQRSPGG